MRCIIGWRGLSLGGRVISNVFGTYGRTTWSSSGSSAVNADVGNLPCVKDWFVKLCGFIMHNPLACPCHAPRWEGSIAIVVKEALFSVWSFIRKLICTTTADYRCHVVIAKPMWIHFSRCKVRARIELLVQHDATAIRKSDQALHTVWFPTTLVPSPTIYNTLRE